MTVSKDMNVDMWYYTNDEKQEARTGEGAHTEAALSGRGTCGLNAYNA
jgi:hypothetical protein